MATTLGGNLPCSNIGRSNTALCFGQGTALSSSLSITGAGAFDSNSKPVYALGSIPRIWWEPLIYAPLLVAAVEVARLLGYKLAALGLNVRMPLVQAAVGATGFVFGVVEYFILRPQAYIAEFTLEELWLTMIILLISTGFVEEFIFRGVMQKAAVQAFGWWGVVYISLLFAVLHMGFLSWLDVVFVFVIALFFGWIVNKTGSLLGVTLSHGITNILLFLVMPFIF